MTLQNLTHSDLSKNASKELKNRSPKKKRKKRKTSKKERKMKLLVLNNKN